MGINPKKGKTMKNIRILSVLFIISVSILACGVFQPAPTATPIPSDTPLPTGTFTPVPTNTPEPSNTPTVEPEPTVVAEGGFSFRAPAGYEVDVQGTQAGIFNEDRTIIISFVGATTNPQNLSTDEIFDQFINALLKKGNGDLKKENPHSVSADGADGLAYDITGTLFNFPVKGQAIVVMRSNDQYVFGLGIANTGGNEKRWENEGSEVFDGLINSIKFLTPKETSSSSGSCSISTDETYGYTQENPIKVGGDAFGGPPRERAYLDNLSGPNGEKVTYVRTGDIPLENTILDNFKVTVAGKTVNLYIDEYAYSEPQAPVGFTCIGAFPLSKP